MHKAVKITVNVVCAKLEKKIKAKKINLIIMVVIIMHSAHSLTCSSGKKEAQCAHCTSAHPY